jgi:hypothetical protein
MGYRSDPVKAIFLETTGMARGLRCPMKVLGYLTHSFNELTCERARETSGTMISVTSLVPAIKKELDNAALAAVLRLRKTSDGKSFECPSLLFTSANFDTVHERDAALAPSHGTIHLSHFFLAFGYPTTTSPSKSKGRLV